MNSIAQFSGRFILAAIIVTSTIMSASVVAATHEVQVFDPSNFSPAVLTIEVGDTVRWVNAAGGSLHDVTADDGSFASVTATGFTFERTFNTIEEVLYYCSVHSRPADEGGTAQNGRINVVAAGGSPDISIEAVSVVDGAYEVGEDLSINSTLKNTSTDDSGMFSISFYVSTDANISTADTLLGSKSIGNIAAGASLNMDDSISLPEDLVAGDYFIGAISNLADSNAANNINVDETSVYVFTDFTINAGLNDAWFEPATSGQGLFVTIFPDLGFVTLAWFTYDTERPPEDATANLGEPGHRWLTALGPVDGDMSVMEISITSGGLFDTVPDEPLPSVIDGTITLKFNNCNEGTVSYDITSINAQGEVPIQRVAADNIALCNALLRELQQTPYPLSLATDYCQSSSIAA